VSHALQANPERERGGEAHPLARAQGSPRVLILFALEREAAPLRRLARGVPHVRVHVTGVGRKAAGEAASRLLEHAPIPALVVAAGFCGALVPALRVGDIVTSPRIFTADHIVGTPAEKRLLAEQQNADAVDMESAAIADACAARGVPFRAVRAVSDAADTALSPDLVQLLSGGNVSPWKAVRALVRKPALLGEFLRLARDTKLASRTLARELMRIVTPSAA
jgi:adenosylhomocysteine nucleosidase